ncbi:hypothetical protein L6164_034036 [Bauhinia variegata]|uniref:Uncharacterized protein n=1 Tax=Bauhinia variegata TaxID=167791 RepID=A0ACB9KUD5_BAUVA|nr:hypothetical protein L6164_034036 [Bauhinia variegata]
MDPATATVTAAAPANVQHVTKKSSDELLRKFADSDSGDEAQKNKRDLRVAKRRKKSRAVREDGQCESPSNSFGSTALVERRSLLPLAATRRSALLRQLGIGRAQLRARELRNKSLLVTIEKTWRRAVEGASRAFMEKHYHRHKRLISDIV